MDRILWMVRPTTRMLDTCPSWLIRTAQLRHGLLDWVKLIINASSSRDSSISLQSGSGAAISEEGICQNRINRMQ